MVRTKDYLARELRAVAAKASPDNAARYEALAVRAETGEFDDYADVHVCGPTALHKELLRHGFTKFAARVANGEFDASLDESEEWARSQTDLETIRLMDALGIMPDRIQLSRAKGWRMPKGAVKVDRSTLWGNPFQVGVHGTAVECVHRFALLCGGLICISDPKIEVQHQQLFLVHLRSSIGKLRGRDLACWCRDSQPCHADVLIELANAEKPDLSCFLIPEICG